MVESIEELKARRQARKEELATKSHEELKQMLDIRERLERKLETDIIRVPLEDDLGKFELKFKKLSPQMHDEFLRLQREHSSTKDKVKEQATAERLYELLEYLSLDGLNKQYWMDGSGYSGDVLAFIMLILMKASVSPDEGDIEKIKTFRKE